MRGAASAGASTTFGALSSIFFDCSASDVLERLAPLEVHDLIGEVEPVHRVVGVGDQARIFGRDFHPREAVRERGAADQDRTIDAGGLQILRRRDHHLRRLDQQARQPDRVGAVLAERLDQFFGRHLDAEIDDAVAVVAENYLDQVFADVVNVALDGRENNLALGRALGLLHVRFEMRDRGLHRLGRLQNFGDDHLVGVEQAPDLVHALHQRAVDDFERAARRQRLVEVLDQAVLRAFEDVAGEAIVERHRLAIFGGDGAFALAEMCGECGDRIVAAPPDQILGELALLFGNRRIALQLFGVDDREVEAGLHAMIEHHGVQHFAAGLRQSEGDVGDAEDGFATRQRLLDQPDAFDRFDAGADIIFVAGADREDQRIEDDVLGLDAVLFGEQLERALRDLQFALARDGLRLLLVLVDASDDQRGAEAARERHDFLEAILAVFEVDRIDQRLARRALERFFDHAVIGRIDHQRNFDFLDLDFEKAGDVGHLVAIRILQAYVEDVRAAAHLHAPDFGRFLDLALRDQPLELAAAEHVGALADDHGARVVVDDQSLDARDDRAPQRRAFSRTFARDRFAPAGGCARASCRSIRRPD